MIARWVRLCVVCLVAGGGGGMMMPTPAAAQIGAGTLSGVVVDPSGSAAAGATVTVTAQATGERRLALAASDGGFVVPSLAPGRYAVRVELIGFRPLERPGITVANRTARNRRSGSS